MKFLSSIFITAALAVATPALSQAVVPTIIDCSDVANAENPACLPDANGVTNVAPLVVGAAGLLGLGALAGGGGTTSTTSTSTTTTN